VIRGRGRLRIDDRDVPAGPGSILYVRATASHSFFEIEEDMTLLVFFASGGSSASPD
jgi:mannose-6-phosphate isomerase-like protein (cupin superfamily)